MYPIDCHDVMWCGDTLGWEELEVVARAGVTLVDRTLKRCDYIANTKQPGGTCIAASMPLSQHAHAASLVSSWNHLSSRYPLPSTDCTASFSSQNLQSAVSSCQFPCFPLCAVLTNTLSPQPPKPAVNCPPHSPYSSPTTLRLRRPSLPPSLPPSHNPGACD